jgi:uroporphyrinogen decarboxylase
METASLDSRGRLVRAARRQPVDRPPVWLLRQAGRYLASYRALREKHSFMEMCLTPELAAQVSLLPLAEIDPDGLIIFNDITIPLVDLGLELSFGEGGPRFAKPVRTMEDVRALSSKVAFGTDAPVARALRILRERAPDRGVLGFCGAPYTLACYAIEGGPDKDFRAAQRMAYTAPEILHALLEKITAAIGSYLAAQVRAGADVVQVFDTWAGHLDPACFRAFALPYARRVITTAREAGAPVIYYLRGGSPFLVDIAESGAEVIGIDWMTGLQRAAAAFPGRALQGNMNPHALFADVDTVKKLTREMLATAPKVGYIANLGHGLMPETPVESVRAFVETVKNYTSQ